MALVVLCLFPASAFAQSAGDEQYADPLAGQNQARQPASTPTQQNQAAPATGTSGNSAPATPAASQQANAGSGSGATAAARGGTLPRTGSDAPLAFTVLGLIALSSGILLRWGVRACYGPSATWNRTR